MHRLLGKLVVLGVGVCILGAQGVAFAQHQPTPQQLAGIAKDNARHFGDDPDNPGPLATNLSYSTKPKAVAKAMRKVADWQLKVSQPYFDRIWTWSALYSGFMAASDSLADPKYRNAMEEMGKKYDWQLRAHLPDADNQSVAQTYLELYLQKHDPAMIRPAQVELDALLAAPRGTTIPGKEIAWWWCDALFMAPPVWSRMYAATGDHKYIDYLNEEWFKTSDRLYDTQEHLYARDSSYLSKREANGKKIFWSRGNGWVMGGIVRTLQYLPNDDQPEVSGSAFFAYALAAGVNQGWLDAKVYRPVIDKAWAGLLHHVYADGRLGCIQQTGAEPAPFKASASYTYGVGAYLLAGSEIRKLHGMR